MRLARPLRRAFAVAPEVGVSVPATPDESTLARLATSENERAILALNVKTLGYELARTRTFEVLHRVDTSDEPRHHGLACGMATQAEVESPWFVHWCDAMRCQPLYHRKLWELASVAQVLFEHGKLAEGSHGIGFGCGDEPLASLFASCRTQVVISDLESGAAAERGWVDTGQHAGSLNQAFKPDICGRADFDAYVSHRTIDMTDIPRDLDSAYDFCWSVCAMEHLGDIESGLRFVERSLDVLRPGGVAVHTTEFNHLDHEPNVVTGPTVYYRRADIERLADSVAARGARLLGPDFTIGAGVLDRYVDVPPFQLGEGLMHAEPFLPALQLAHLKVALDGIPCTCYRIIVVKDA
jgi:hypothetical protein